MKTYASEPTKPIEVRDSIVTDPEILGVEPVFRGTRVPVVSLFAHLSGMPFALKQDELPDVNPIGFLRAPRKLFEPHDLPDAFPQA